MDLNRSVSRWSTVTRSTVDTSHTIPLVAVRRKLLRQSNDSSRPFLQRNNRSKHNIEELFKLYYSNDLQFDGFQKEIVTGKRIHTAKPVGSRMSQYADSSTGFSAQRIHLSREPYSRNESEKRGSSSKLNRSLPVEISPDEERPTTHWHRIPTIPPATESSVKSEKMNNQQIPTINITNQYDEFLEPSIVKSVSFLEETNHLDMSENDDEINQPEEIQNFLSSKSSFQSVTTKTPQTSIIMSSPKYPANVASSTSKTVKYNIQGSMRTSTSISARYRSAAKKYIESNSRIKSSSSQRTATSAKTITFAPGLKSATPRTLETDLEHDDDRESNGSQRVVSIPSRCSRYVLVSFPEVPLRYNAPSYVERLLLPERFPNMFQNIVRSYESRSRSAPNHRIIK